jgi:predicted nucleic acid-binding protein
MAALVVADASVLIALGQVGQLSLLEQLFGEVVVPPAVEREVVSGRPPLPGWVRTRPLLGALDSRVTEAALGAGESETISLALEAMAERVILDDLPARRLARGLGLRVVGTAGVLFLAKRRGFITAIRPTLDALRAAGFRLRLDVYREVLKSAGEGE